MKKNLIPSTVLFISFFLLILPGCAPLKPAFPPAASQPAPVQVEPSSEGLPASSPFPASSPTADVSDGRELIPAFIPAGYTLADNPASDPDRQQTILTFLSTQPLEGTGGSMTATKTITLVQSPRNDQPPLQIFPSANLQDVRVNGQPAIYTVGAWDASFVSDPAQPGGGSFQYAWRSDLQIQNVFWQVQEVYLVLITDDMAIPLEDLIKMAASVR